MRDVLIVDDNLANTALLDRILNDKKYSIRHTSNPNKAFKLIEEKISGLILVIRDRSNGRSRRKESSLIKEIENSQMQTIFSLAKLAQSRDDDTGEHLERVRKFCSALAENLSKDSPYANVIDETFIVNIENASPLHDIGKVGISDLILLKPGKLTPEEFEIMKTHVIIGAETLETVQSSYSQNEFVNMGILIARYHHERWDGCGYPDKLKGEEIPLAARIMAIADVYDALRTKRSYKDSFSHEKSKSIILEGKGTQFDPIIVEAFEKIDDKFNLIWQESQVVQCAGLSA